MVLYPYVAALAVDGNTREIAAGVTGQVFAKSDTTFTTPLATVDATGLPVELTSSANGILPSFYVEDEEGVNWKSGDWVFPLVTSQPVPGPQGAQVVAADVAGDALTFELSDGTTTAPVTLPTGPGGSNSGVADYVTVSGPTQSALDGRFRKKDLLPVNIKDAPFNAVGDGVADDTDAVEAFFDHLGTVGGVGYAEGVFKCTRTIAIAQHANSFTFYGAGQARTKFAFSGTTTNSFYLRETKDCRFESFTIDGGRAGNVNASHAVSATNCQDTTFQNVKTKNYGNTGIMFTYAPEFITPSTRNHIINCPADGGGLANNGHMLESTTDSTMLDCDIYGLNKNGSPSYGLQLKNATQRCTVMGGSVRGAIAGVAFGNTTGGIATDNVVTGVRVSDCVSGIMMGYAERNIIRAVHIDMTGLTAPARAVRLDTGCRYNDIDVTVSNVAEGVYACYLNSNENTVRISSLTNVSGYILGLTAGSSNNVFVLGRVLGAPNVALPQSKFVDNSGNTTNAFRYETDLSELEATTATGVSRLRFGAPGNRNTYVEYRHADNAWVWPVAGVNKFAATGIAFYPWSSAGMSLGLSSRAWKELFLASPNGTVYKVSVSDTGTLSATVA